MKINARKSTSGFFFSHFPYGSLQFSQYNGNQQIHTVVLDLQQYYKGHKLLLVSGHIDPSSVSN